MISDDGEFIGEEVGTQCIARIKHLESFRIDHRTGSHEVHKYIYIGQLISVDLKDVSIFERIDGVHTAVKVETVISLHDHGVHESVRIDFHPRGLGVEFEIVIFELQDDLVVAIFTGAL